MNPHLITVHSKVIDQCETASITDGKTFICRVCDMVSEDKFHLQHHRDNYYESNFNTLTETVSDKHNMVDCGASVGGKHIRKNALVNQPILEDKSNEAQRSHISNVCEKIIPTTIRFDDHMDA